MNIIIIIVGLAILYLFGDMTVAKEHYINYKYNQYNDEFDNDDECNGTLYKQFYQVHFYNFDRTITSKKVHIYSEKHIDDMHRSGQLLHLFGGSYRLKELTKHLELLNAKGIKLYIFSTHNVANVEYILDLMNLSKYFNGVYKSSKYENKLCKITCIMGSLGIPMWKGLLIDNKYNDVKLVAPYMQTYHITDKKHGMNVRDMHQLFNL